METSFMNGSSEFGCINQEPRKWLNNFSRAKRKFQYKRVVRKGFTFTVLSLDLERILSLFWPHISYFEASIVYIGCK